HVQEDGAIGAVAGLGDIDLESIAVPVQGGAPGSVSVLEPVTMTVTGVIRSGRFNANGTWGTDCLARVMAKQAIGTAGRSVDNLRPGEPAKFDFFRHAIMRLGCVIHLAAELGAHDAEVMAVFDPLTFGLVGNVAAGI